jgi:hypothetical protein
MDTHSGFPMFSPEQRSYFMHEKAEYDAKVTEFSDRTGLINPYDNFTKWRQNDCKAPCCHPMQAALLMCRAYTDHLEQLLYASRSSFEAGEIDDAEHTRRQAQCNMQRGAMEAEFRLCSPPVTFSEDQ